MKNKIFNDPIYGLIKFTFPIIYQIIEKPIFQRLRRVAQMGMASMVYTGVNHTRFAHALGATHLMMRAIQSLKSKGVDISNEEAEAACVAILCHDMGHGPFSHALEFQLLPQHHEQLTLEMMKSLALEFGEPIELAIQIFTGHYHKTFLHELVSSQLDVDRLDYLARDSFYSGVAEGVVGTSRIIEMLDVVDNRIVVEEKGIYSIEKFLHARNIMYWQVYLHKTALAAEKMLQSAIRRSIDLHRGGVNVVMTPNMMELIDINPHQMNDEVLNLYSTLDDSDIWYLLKSNATHADEVLRCLCDGLVNRKIFKVSTLTEEELVTLQMQGNVLNIDEPVNSIQNLQFIERQSTTLYDHVVNPIRMRTKKGAIVDLQTLIPGLDEKHSHRERIFYIRPGKNYFK